METWWWGELEAKGEEPKGRGKGCASPDACSHVNEQKREGLAEVLTTLGEHC